MYSGQIFTPVQILNMVRTILLLFTQHLEGETWVNTVEILKYHPIWPNTNCILIVIHLTFPASPFLINLILGFFWLQHRKKKVNSTFQKIKFIRYFPFYIINPPSEIRDNSWSSSLLSFRGFVIWNQIVVHQ